MATSQPYLGEGVAVSKLTQLLDCPGCHQVPIPPIILCLEGHSVCFKCRSRLDRCPLCAREFSTARNLLAEELIQCLSRKCPNAKEGCDMVLSQSEWESHEAECAFR